MATDIFFTTNEAEIPLLEGLYLVERNPPGFIRGQDLSLLGIGGLTVRGPETPLRVSTARFVEVYGERDYGSGDLKNEVWAALINKPISELVCRRVVATDAVAASITLEDGVDGTGTAICRIDATSRGAWAQGAVSVKVEAASDGDANHFNLREKYLGTETLYENIDLSAVGNDNAAEVLGDDAANRIKIVKLADGRPADFSTITEVDWVAKDDTDGFMALGTTLTAYVSVAGSDGTAVAADYNAALTDLANVDGPAVVYIAGASVDQNSLNATIVTEAAQSNDRMFLAWAGTHAQATATEIANLTTDITTRSDRIKWLYNSAYTLDPETGLEILRGPHEFMGGILTNIDVDVHPGARETAAFNAGVKRLSNEALTRPDLKALRAAGISTLEKLKGRFQFRSARTTSLETGKEETTRRRMADFLQLSAADKLSEFVKAKNTPTNRALVSALLVAFSQGLRDDERVVEEFSIDQISVNTPASRGKGIERILWRVKIIGHILHLVLETEIGTSVVIEQ